LLLLHRMDGCARLATVTVQRKIATVVLTGRSTLELADSFAADSADEPGLLPAMIGGAGVFAVPGGLPIVHGGEILGVVAVSGSSSADDHDLAVAGTAGVPA
jgi:glc operon protein GlcG